ncbi:hypothetical protein DITRI_Ditri20bG0051000 [Diplodiscus trichospermus]
MDPRDAALLEALRFLEVELEKKREKTRLMEESHRADQAALKAKEGEVSLLRVLADEEAQEKLFSDFLEADGNLKNFDAKTMMGVLAPFLSPDGPDGNDAGGFGGVYGVGLANTQNLDKDRAVMTTINEGTKVEGDPGKDGAVMDTIEGAEAVGDPDKDGAVATTIEETKVDGGAVTTTVEGTKADRE